MNTEDALSSNTPLPNVFSAGDVRQILEERNWLREAPSEKQTAWCERAAALLGPHAADREALAEWLGLVFRYDALEILATVDAQVVMSRNGAREVIRQLALLLLSDGPLSTERFKEIIVALKEHLDYRGRELFHPLRLVLAGRAGEGELDRVALLLDEAAAAEFAARVKTARERVVEFCAALD
jgi:hypothetical protein